MLIHQLPPLALHKSTRSPSDAIPSSFNHLATRALNHMPTKWPTCSRQCLNPTLPRRAPSSSSGKTKPRDCGGRHTLQEGTQRDEISICVSPRSDRSLSLIGITSPSGSAGGISGLSQPRTSNLQSSSGLPQYLREATGSCDW